MGDLQSGKKEQAKQAKTKVGCHGVATELSLQSKDAQDEAAIHRALSTERRVHRSRAALTAEELGPFYSITVSSRKKQGLIANAQCADFPTLAWKEAPHLATTNILITKPINHPIALIHVSVLRLPASKPL
eukprot:scaffold45476_cov27-Tisochrysis_lutea.AAC.1